MHYFVSSREDPQTSAIEIAQARRQKLFDFLGADSQIVEIERNDFSVEAQGNLGTKNRVINIYRFFQGEIVPKSLKRGMQNLVPVNSHAGKTPYIYLYQSKKILEFHLHHNRLFYADNYDQYGFLQQRVFFLQNNINYIEKYDSQANLTERDFPDEFGDSVVSEFYCQSTDNQPMLTQIKVKYAGGSYVFNNYDEFYAFFFDCLVELDPQAVFYCDRESVILKGMTLMQHSVPRFAIIHSAIYYDDQKTLYPVFEPLGKLVKLGKLTGIICATKQEQQDIMAEYGISQVYALPVTYVKPIKAPLSYRAGNLIAVARTDGVKNLRAMVMSVILLKRKYPNLTLNIYGNVTDKKAAKELDEIIKKRHAESYIHYGEFSRQINHVYQTAELNLLTSHDEGFAMALVEAQANGCACLSYDIKYGPREIIKDGVSGKLTKPNWIDFMHQLDYLLSNPSVIEQYKLNALKQANKYSFENVAQAWSIFLKANKLE